MIQSQIVVLEVFYESDLTDGKTFPANWDWNALIDEPIFPAAKVIAAGEIRDHPTMEEDNG